MIENRINWGEQYPALQRRGLRSLREITINLGIATGTMLSVVQPAKAILYNHFEFTDRFGSKGTGGTITGTIGFDSLDAHHSGIDTVSATSFVIDSIPSYFESVWTDNLTFGVGKNIVGAGNNANPSFTRTYSYFNKSYNPSNTFTITNRHLQ
jgi:hypothetical protein